MVGFPGSGKTTWAEKYHPTVFRASQDELGSRHNFLKAVEQHLKDGESVVADRCNHTRRHRAALVQLARRYGASAEVVWVATPHKQAVAQLKERKDHPTIPFESKEKISIYYRFSYEFDRPNLEQEEFDSLEIVGTVSRCINCSLPTIQGPGDSFCVECHMDKNK